MHEFPAFEELTSVHRPPTNRVVIRGGGLAGQVLRRELNKNGIISRVEEKASFPRHKVCGGILQWDSWKYLISNFHIEADFVRIYMMSHFWNKRFISRIKLEEPMVFIPRIQLDEQLNRVNTEEDHVSDSFDEHGITPENQITISAVGGTGKKGKWMGFQGEIEGLQKTCDSHPELRMYYSKGLYLGLVVNPKGTGHAAFMVRDDKRLNFRDLSCLVQKQFGLPKLSAIRGTGKINFGYQDRHLAVGDAMLMFPPFLGLGMKHAILSSQLMAACILSGNISSYTELHRKIFRRWYLSSQHLDNVYDSIWAVPALYVFLRPKIFHYLYKWLHKPYQLRTGGDIRSPNLA